MKSSRRIALVFALGLALAVALGVRFLRPVPIVTEDQCQVATGKVLQVSEGSSYDVFIQLENISTRFYINRGLERGLDLQSLRRDLMGKEVTLKYPHYWTPLDPMNSTRHVFKLELDGKVLFDETKASE